MVRHALALLLGVLLAIGAQQIPWWPLLNLQQWLAGLGLMLLAVMGALRWSRIQWLPTLLAGWCWASWPLLQYQSALLADESGERVLAVVTIDSLPYRRGAEASFDARLQVMRGGAAPSPEGATRRQRARLQWPDAPPLQVGERWQLLLALSPLPQRANPGRAAARWQWLRQRLHAGGRVLPSRLNLMQRAAPWSVDRLREQIALQLRQQINERDAAALAVALAVGETRYLSAEQWRVFNTTGIAHLVAISGLHVTLFSLLAAAVGRRSWRRLPRLQRWRRESFAGLLGFTAAAAYTLLAGFPVPAQRTLIMLGSWYLLRALARPLAAAPALAVALLAVLMLDPWAPLSAGFWLSFVAVAVLIYAVADHAGGSWRTATRTQLSVMVGLLPVSLAIFGSVSLLGVAVNFIAIPLFSLVLVPLVLTAALTAWCCPPLSEALSQALSWLHGLIWPWLLRAAELPFALWRPQGTDAWLLLCVPALILALWPWRWPMRCSAALVLLPLLFPAVRPLRAGEYRLTMLDVGRGLAIIVRTRHHTLLYDNGEVWGSAGAVSAHTLLPALRSYRLPRIDRLVLPRLDADRVAGALALGSELPLAMLLSADSGSLPPEFSACEPGSVWRWDEVEFRFVSAGTCALRIAGADGTAALLADELSLAAQQRLVNAGAVTAAIVVAPRHGAASGYSRQLRDASAARWLLVSQNATGRTEAVQRVLAAWREAGTTPLVTAELGAIELRVGLDGMQQRHYRRSLPTKPY